MRIQKILRGVLVLAVLTLLIPGTPVFSQTPTPPGVQRLMADAVGKVALTLNATSARPSFISADLPLSAAGYAPAAPAQAVQPAPAAMAFVQHYADAFGVRDAGAELKVDQVTTDTLMQQRVRLSQTYQGVKVYDGYIDVHLSADGQQVLAVSNSFIPGIALASVTPQLSADQALALAQTLLPRATLESPVQLVIYAGLGSASNPVAKLAWLVALRDDAVPARNIYVLDANSGSLIDRLDRLYDARVRLTYSANNTQTLPGDLKRSEADGPTGDTDTDNAHNFAGDTYDYYLGTFGRDSYDGQGATLSSTVHYGVNFLNAFWNGQQMVYGDGFPAKDVSAHELTHAVTEHTAQLEYSWQSGALNESISDIFGAMVDRSNWLIGEDLPPSVLAGRDALRDMADPARLGQPDNTASWVTTCSDNQGVHTNSGITNKAYYNIATAIGKSDAEQIFYRTLTVYLWSTAGLEDARAAALQSAQDLYGAESTQYQGVWNGFNAVGLDGQWQPPANDCTCAASTALADTQVYPNQASALQIAATLYQTRDQLLSPTAAGQHYQALYEQYTGRISFLLILNPALRDTGAQLLGQVTPGLNAVLNGQGSTVVVSQDTVSGVQAYLLGLANADRAQGGGDLATTIDHEMARINWAHLVGLTYDQARSYFNSVGYQVVYLPMLSR